MNDSTQSSDLSAVQADDRSMYEAEYTSFEGFAGQVFCSSMPFCVRTNSVPLTVTIPSIS